VSAPSEDRTFFDLHIKEICVPFSFFVGMELRTKVHQSVTAKDEGDRVLSAGDEITLETKYGLRVIDHPVFIKLNINIDRRVARIFWDCLQTMKHVSHEKIICDRVFAA
jgi:hypothetical protein